MRQRKPQRGYRARKPSLLSRLLGRFVRYAFPVRNSSAILTVPLSQIPVTLADNAGLDSSDLVSRLRAAHFNGQHHSGLGIHYFTTAARAIKCSLVDLNNGTVTSMRDLGVTESFKLKRQVLLSASEAAEMILRYAGRNPQVPCPHPLYIQSGYHFACYTTQARSTLTYVHHIVARELRTYTHLGVLCIFVSCRHVSMTVLHSDGSILRVSVHMFALPVVLYCEFQRLKQPSQTIVLNSVKLISCPPYTL